MKLNTVIFLLILVGTMISGSCKDNNVAEDVSSDTSVAEHKRNSFACGADVSWLTQMESEGLKFYTPDGKHEEKECMELLRDYCGIDAIRLRVWVNPDGGWNNIDDVLVKALRAKKLGLRLMIDFHFSDTWADPHHQVIPAEWSNYDVDGLASAVSNHVSEVLGALKKVGITPEWVQIGNETSTGMLLPLGSVDNPENLVKFNNAGYDAVKRICPDAKVIVHLEGAHDQAIYDRMLGIMERLGGKYDMIGMSVYPYWAEENGVTGGWRKIAYDCVSNISHLRSVYHKPVMICEIGMPYDKEKECEELIDMMMSTDVEGIFYWEPEAPAGYNDGYNLGCFNNGMPTSALNPFKNKQVNNR